MRALLGLVLLLVVGAAVVAEVALPSLVEARVEERVRANTDDAAVVEAEVSRFPFLPALLLEGRVESLTVSLEELAGHEVTFGDVHLGAHGIAVDRRDLVAGQVTVTGIDVGFLTIEIVDERVARADEAIEQLGPEAVELRDRVLELSPEGSQRLELPVDERLLPCEPEVEIEGDVVRLTCEVDEVPPMLLESAVG